MKTHKQQSCLWIALLLLACHTAINAETPIYPIVDSAQIDCYSNTDMIEYPLPGEPFYGQDAQYIGQEPNYVDNGNDTVTDLVTGLMWQKTLSDKMTFEQAVSGAEAFTLANYNDWRLPTIKELYSLILFSGIDPGVSARVSDIQPFIDTDFFDFEYGDPSSGERIIDAQYWSATEYVWTTMNGNPTTFGVNFADGRIKGYPSEMPNGTRPTCFVRYVRGNPDYGTNQFADNGDGTISDLATGLMWMQNDSNMALNWEEALVYAEDANTAGYDDWRLPNIKELQSILDYTRAPDTTHSAAIDPNFRASTIINEAGQEDWPFYWSSTTHVAASPLPYSAAAYMSFGRAMGYMLNRWMDVHGAGAQRSDPKQGDPANFPFGRGPQGDSIRIYNHVRCVRTITSKAKAAENILLTIAGANPAPTDLAELPLAVTFDGFPVDLATVKRPSQQEINFDFPTYGLAPGDYPVEVSFAPPSGLQAGTFTLRPSILLMIVDDWGHDASPLDNTEPGVHLAHMPHLDALASEGLRFTQAYAQPTCSPTRAAMLTGRQAWQTGVGHALEETNFSSEEITLPEILITMNAPHRMLTVGKWHLGGGNDGYRALGGWPEFYGINGGDIDDYSNWEKNSNGTVATTTVYSTTDQVNEAKAFIDTNVSAGTPWFAWVAFNAPHTPFHDPPEDLAPEGGYSNIREGESTESHQYRKMLEALDTEIGRLLESIDPAQTDIILIGDNGTHKKVVQAPYGKGHAKGDLYNGGIHVPMIVEGPSVTVTPGSTTSTLVHCTDIFSTILDLAGIDEASVPGLAAQGVNSTSIVPILNGTDSTDRYVVAERGGDTPGRAIIVDEFPDYKLIINGDPDNALDDPTFEFYNIGSPAYDLNEKDPLDTASLTGTALDAYNACITEDLALGGGYSDPPTNFDTVYIELPDSGVDPEVPALTQPDGDPIEVVSVTVDGNPAYLVGRFNSGPNLANEDDDVERRYWVKARIAPAYGGPYLTAHVVFPDQATDQGSAAREYDSVNTILVNPNP